MDYASTDWYRTQQNKFIDILFHDDHNSRYVRSTLTNEGKWVQHPAKLLKTIKSQIAKSISTDKNEYISVNGFSGLQCCEVGCRQINAIVLDLDGHNCDLEDLDNIKFNTFSAINSAISKNEIPRPTMIIDSGRGLQIYYVFDRSISYRITGGSLNTNFLNDYKQSYKILMELYNQILTANTHLLDVDKQVSNISRVMRIPGTYNTKAQNFADLVCAEGPYCRLTDILLYDSQLSIDNSPEASSHTKEGSTGPLGKSVELPALHKSLFLDINMDETQSILLQRLIDLQTLQNLRNCQCDGQKEIMNFLFFNSASKVFNEDKAKKLLYHFNANFITSTPVSEAELINIVNSVAKKGHYSYKKIKIIEILSVTAEEQAALGWTSPFDKRKLRKLQGKLIKDKRDTSIIDLAKNGFNHKSISTQLNVSLRTVQNVLKNAGITRVYKKHKVNADIIRSIIASKKSRSRYSYITKIIVQKNVSISIFFKKLSVINTKYIERFFFFSLHHESGP